MINAQQDIIKTKMKENALAVELNIANFALMISSVHFVNQINIFIPINVLYNVQKEHIPH